MNLFFISLAVIFCGGLLSLVFWRQFALMKTIGVIGIGRVTRGKIKPNSAVVVVDTEGKERRGRMLQIFGSREIALQLSGNSKRMRIW